MVFAVCRCGACLFSLYLSLPLSLGGVVCAVCRYGYRYVYRYVVLVFLSFRLSIRLSYLLV